MEIKSPPHNTSIVSIPLSSEGIERVSELHSSKDTAIVAVKDANISINRTIIGYDTIDK